MRDDLKQAEAAATILRTATAIVITLPCLCEMLWVLRSAYDLPREQIVLAVRELLQTGSVLMNRPAVEFGLAAMKRGADFSDAVIAFEGSWLGGDTFVSFDRKAVSLLAGQGLSTKLLA